MDLIRRGQAGGVFRDDLPAEWLASALFYVMNGAAADVAGGRLASDDASLLITSITVAAYTRPKA